MSPSSNDKITWTTETRRLGDLVPWERNPRQTTQEQAERLKRSLRKFNYSQLYEIEPDNTILDGHQRDALMQLMTEWGENAEIEVRVASRKFSLDERKEYIALKHEGAQGEWDWEAMHNLYLGDELLDFGFAKDDLEAHGFEWNGDELPDDLGPEEDRAEELREKWGVESGMMFALGAHRLICGDCMDAEVVERVMGGERAVLIIADPPYNVNYNYDDEFDDNISDYSGWLHDWISLSCKNLINCWIAVKNIPKNLYALQDALEVVGEYRNTIVWPHSTGAIPSNRFVPAWECWAVYSIGRPIFNAKAQTTERQSPDFLGGGINPNGRINEIWDDIKHVSAGSRKSKEAILKPGTNEKMHHAQMPISLSARFIEFCTDNSGIIYDPFLGSGTTMVAAHRLRRRCFGIEISPAYCAVTLERMNELGVEPELISP